MLFMVLANDAGDEGAMDRRMAARPDHTRALDQARDSKDARFGAAMLDEAGRMCGSMIVLDMPDLASVEAWLAQEPYVKANVWGDVRVIPLKLGASFEGEFSSKYDAKSAA